MRARDRSGDARDEKVETPTANADRLEAAIDHVAARMVQVRRDDDLAFCIAGALPDRASRFGWLIPQFGVIAAFAIAALLWTTRDTPPPSLLSSTKVVAVIAVPDTAVAIAPGTVLRSQPLEPLEPLEPLDPLQPLDPLKVDFERSLSPIEAMSALVMSDVAPGELPASAALVLAPIEIADLPMTAESFPPR